MSQHLTYGVQGFSKPSPTLSLWAADPHHKPNDVRALLTSRGIEFAPCLGAYNGVHELSYCTSLAAFETIAAQLCGGQESVLILGSKDSRNRRSATLRWLASDLETDLGRFYSVHVDEARKRNAFTIVLGQRTAFKETLAFVCDPVDKFGEPILS